MDEDILLPVAAENSAVYNIKRRHFILPKKSSYLLVNRSMNEFIFYSLTN